MNIFDAKVEAGKTGLVLRAGPCAIAIPPVDGLAPGDKCSFGIRPEHMDVISPGKADLIASCALSEQLGGETYLYCEVEGLPQITVHRPGQLSVSEGEAVALSMDRAKLHIFDRNGLALANGVPS